MRVSVEGKRGCGFRQPGGLYLVGAPYMAEPCSALPLPLDVCPICHSGIKPARGWTWIDPRHLLQLPRGPHAPEEHYERCPLAQLDGLGLGERAGLLWIGEKFYATPADFTDEARTMGVSRRISAMPKDYKPGTWVLLAHRKAIPVLGVGHVLLEPPPEQEYRPGVFHIFRPRAVEYIVRGDESDEEIEALQKRGIELVKVVRAGTQTDLLDDVPDEEAL